MRGSAGESCAISTPVRSGRAPRRPPGSTSPSASAHDAVARGLVALDAESGSRRGGRTARTAARYHETSTLRTARTGLAGTPAPRSPVAQWLIREGSPASRARATLDGAIPLVMKTPVAQERPGRPRLRDALGVTSIRRRPRHTATQQPEDVLAARCRAHGRIAARITAGAGRWQARRDTTEAGHPTSRRGSRSARSRATRPALPGKRRGGRPLTRRLKRQRTFSEEVTGDQVEV